ncbi:hypothetical protein TNCV_2450741 [Trichonephila clavipes]|nr:hypothetical protein TNCV_2450741 [Trichonephila clavipes]
MIDFEHFKCPLLVDQRPTSGFSVVVSNATCKNEVELSQNEAHEIHRGKELEVHLSLALNTIKVTVRISSTKFPEGKTDGDTTDFHLHNFGMELKVREIFSSRLHSLFSPQDFRTH